MVWVGVPKAPLRSLWAPKAKVHYLAIAQLQCTKCSYIDPNPSQKREGKEKKRKEKKRQEGGGRGVCSSIKSDLFYPLENPIHR
jgi:hypothetical protein